jgi:hypothetical protein
MPAPTEKAARWFRMARAVAHGHTLHGLEPGTMAKLKETAAGMTEAQLVAFSHVASKPKTKGK